jgi:hypothetical protein
VGGVASEVIWPAVGAGEDELVRPAEVGAIEMENPESKFSVIFVRFMIEESTLKKAGP